MMMKKMNLSIWIQINVNFVKKKCVSTEEQFEHVRIEHEEYYKGMLEVCEARRGTMQGVS